jgi:hypothetical protein
MQTIAPFTFEFEVVEEQPLPEATEAAILASLVPFLEISVSPKSFRIFYLSITS